MTGIVLAFALFIILVVMGVRNPRRCLYFAVFMSPWNGVAVDVGLQVSVYSVAITAFVAVVLFHRGNSWDRGSKAISRNPWLWAFIIYAVVWSLAQIWWLPALSVSGGGARTPQVRALTQVLMFGLSISPILLVPLVVRQSEDIIRCARAYLWSVAILALLGFVQLIMWYGSGSDPFPIGLVNALLTGSSTDTLRSGIDHVGGFSVYRMSSFGGEPKGLATGLAVGLLILQAGYSSHVLSRKKKIVRKGLGLWLLLACALLLTWSTSGVFLWLIGTITLSISGIGMTGPSRGKKNLIVGTLTLLLVLGGYYAVTQSNAGRGNDISALLNQRFVERNPIEDFDETLLDFLKNEPEYIFLGVGLGNAHLYARPYIPSYALFYMRNTVFIAKSGYLRLVSELGLVGLLLFSGSVFWWLSALRRNQHLRIQGERNQQLTMILYSLGMVIFVGGMARVYIWPQMFLVLGLCAAYLGLLQNERRNRAMIRHGFDLQPQSRKPPKKPTGALFTGN